jgi:hypothetical protein
LNKNLLAKTLNGKNSSFDSPIAASNTKLTYLDCKFSSKIENYQMNPNEYYLAVVTNVDIKTGHVYLRFLEPNQSFETTKEIQNELINYFELKSREQDIQYNSQFISECLKKKIFLACIAKFNNKKYYRCEIVEEMKDSLGNSLKRYQVIDIDNGLDATVGLDSIFRPMVNHLKIERQIYKFQLNERILRKSTNVNFFERFILFNKIRILTNNCYF